MPLSQLDPYWQTRDEATVRLYHGDALEVLERLPSQSVHCAVTSPPYWNLRDYQTGTWKGGNPDCDHIHEDSRREGVAGNYYYNSKGQRVVASGIRIGAILPPPSQYPNLCRKCGARRTDQQIGAESHPDLYVSRLVEVFRELRRVLRDDGTFWLDIGDTFGPKGDWKRPGMVGIPHRLAFALQDDGWILAMEHICSKPDAMPESATNRCTRAHEYVFMFVKRIRYFFDGFSIMERSVSSNYHKPSAKEKISDERECLSNGRYTSSRPLPVTERNKRSVWTVPNSGYKGAHFAVYSPALILPCIKAGTSEKGCCTECGAPWKRVIERVRQPTRPGENSKTFHGGTKGAPPGKRQHSDLRERLNGEVTGNRDPERHVTSLRHLGWYPSCKCYGLPQMPPAPHRGADWNDVNMTVGVGRMAAGNHKARRQGRVRGESVSERHLPDATRDAAYDEWVKQVRELCRQAEEEHGDLVESCVVLDPFIGSGTTAVVCVGLGRYSMGIDLSEEYLKKNAIPRIEGELLGRPALANLVPR
jgi:DNA modification methylase